MLCHGAIDRPPTLLLWPYNWIGFGAMDAAKAYNFFKVWGHLHVEVGPTCEYPWAEHKLNKHV